MTPKELILTIAIILFLPSLVSAQYLPTCPVEAREILDAVGGCSAVNNECSAYVYICAQCCAPADENEDIVSAAGTGDVTSPTLELVIQNVLNPLAYMLITLTVIVFLWGLVEFVSKADDPEGREKGRKHLIWGIVGLSIIAAAYGIMNFIQNSLLSLFN